MCRLGHIGQQPGAVVGIAAHHREVDIEKVDDYTVRFRLKEPSAFRYMGKGNVPVVDLFDITTGRATYGQDVMRPGMKFAVVARLSLADYRPLPAELAA